MGIYVGFVGDSVSFLASYGNLVALAQRGEVEFSVIRGLFAPDK
jgi:hypothetical protein